ncbi:hypothetical protein FGO68_gene8134 [Halteria grandinella]|uniref:TRP C-terminal domain-containing protein n=1 Tax=Halteria grandinella TaxID=5974 RepID=A0A8J8P532_HALGN|nr:hypothetical protein FGO68_gene8134 [Halteria grandinella]
MAYLFGLLNDISTVTMLSFINISIPGQASVLSSILLNLIYMDLLQTDKWMDKIVDLDDEDNDRSLCPSFERVGYTSMNTISNLGSTFVFLIFIILAYLTTLVLQFLSRTKFKRAFEFMKKQLIWNAALRFMIQQYQSILLACFINTNLALQNFTIDAETMKQQTSNIGDKMSIYTNFILFASVVLFPFIVVGIIQFKKEQIKTEDFNNKFGTIMEGLNCENSLYWNVIVLVRWGFSYTIFVFMKDFASLQIFLLLFVSIGFTIAIAYIKPYQTPSENNFKIWIEVFVTWYLFLLLMLTDINPDVKLREIFGYCVLGVIVLCVAANAVKAVHAAVKEIIWKLETKRKTQKYAINDKKQKVLQNQSNDTTVNRSISEVSQIREEIDVYPQKKEEKKSSKNKESQKQSENKMNVKEPIEKIKLKAKNSTWLHLKSLKANRQKQPPESSILKSPPPHPFLDVIDGQSIRLDDEPNELPISSYAETPQDLVNQLYHKVQQEELMRQGSQVRHTINIIDDNSLPAFIQRTMTKKPFSEQKLI